MLSSPRNPPRKKFMPPASLRFTPGEVQHQLVEDAFQKFTVAPACALLVDLVYAPCGPGVHGWINIAKSPFISGYLSVGMHVPLAEHQRELLFGEVGIDQG